MPAVTVAEMRAQLNLPDAQDEALLASKVEVATAWVAAYSGEELTATSPAPLREAVRLLAGHLYENREASLVGITAQALPFGVHDLISPYRAFAF